MNAHFGRFLLVIPLTLILSIIPIPAILNEFRPPWICMLILYLQCFLPRYFNLSLVMILGLCQDVLLSTVMGEHAFALLCFSWIVSTKSRRFQFFSIFQQMALTGFCCFIYQAILVLIDIASGFHFILWKPLITGLSAIILWPWVRLSFDTFVLVKNKKSELR